MLVTRIPSSNKIDQRKFQPGMFTNLQAGSLLVVDWVMLENLWDVTARAVQDGSFRLVLLVDTKTLDSSDKLTQLNLSLRSLWSSTMVVIKPWSGGIERAIDGMFPTSSIPHIANRISQGIRRLPKLLRTQVCLLCMHKSGKVVSNGPPAPPSPNKQFMLSMEVDSYLRTVAEAATAQAAINLWQPGPVQAAPLKRLQPGAKKGKTHRGGAQGKGHSKGYRGHGGYRGGHRGGRGGGSGGRGGSSRGRCGPTIINSGIHYHKW